MIKLHLLTQSQVNEFYCEMAIANSTLKIVFNNSEEGLSWFMDFFAISIKKILDPLIVQDDFSDDLFQLELMYCLNQCLLNKELTKPFGKLWLASNDNILKVFQIMAS